MRNCLLSCIILFGLIAVSSLSHAAVFVGKLQQLRKDTVLEIATLKGMLPPLQQRVDVYTTFENTGLAPESNIGRGHIIKINKNSLLIKVILVYGTWMTPVPEANQALLPDHILKLKWQGSGTPIINETTELEKAEESANFRQFDIAKKIVDSLIIANPSCVNCIGLRGKIAYRQDQYSLADSLLSLAIKMKPNRSDFYSFRALTYQALKKSIEAQSDVDSALFYGNSERKENIINLLKMNIHLCLELGKKDKVCQSSNRLKTLAPESFAFRNFDHFYCNPQSLSRARYYVKGKLTFYSTSRLEIQLEDKGKKYNKAKFSKSLKPGQYIFPESYFVKGASAPVAKVYSVEGNKVILEIYYWTGTQEMEPNSQPMQVDSDYYFFFE